MLGSPGIIGAGGNGVAGATGGAVGNSGVGGATGCTGSIRGGSVVPPEGEGNSPGVGRTVGGIAMLGGATIGGGVVAVGEFVLAGGVGFFGPKIRESSPGRFGGSGGVSGMVAAPEEVFVLAELVG
jgi:hypothetical protein